MKYFCILLFTLLVGGQCLAQAPDKDKLLYLEKVEKYHRMKNTGKTLTILGSGLNIVGILVLANTSSTTTYNGYGSPQTTTSGNPEAGIAAYLVGYACLGVGIPLWIVGGVNEGRYQRKFDAVSLRPQFAPHGGGFTLRYKF